jgi:hypothetical protein
MKEIPPPALCLREWGIYTPAKIHPRSSGDVPGEIIELLIT